MIYLKENILAVLDVETTGQDCSYHEILQVAVVPLDSTTLEPHPDYPPFYQNIRPNHPERFEPDAMRANGLDMEQMLLCPEKEYVADVLRLWFRDMGLPMGKTLIPICQNSPFDVPFTQQWLGHKMYNDIFNRKCRDTIQIALAINDEFAFKGFAPPFNAFGLKDLCKHFAIELLDHHDALADCIATAKVYRELLRMEHV